MDDYAEQGFAFLVFPADAAQFGAKAALEAAKDAFDLPALSEHAPEKSPPHLPTVFRGRPASRLGPALGRDDAVGAQFFADKFVHGFGVGARVPERAPKVDAAVSLAQQLGRFARVAAGAFGQTDGHDDVRNQVGAKRQLGKVQGAPAGLGFPAEIIGDVAGFQAGAVAGDLGARLDQPAALGAADAVIEKADEGVFLARRSWARQSAE